MGFRTMTVLYRLQEHPEDHREWSWRHPANELPGTIEFEPEVRRIMILVDLEPDQNVSVNMVQFL